MTDTRDHDVELERRIRRHVERAVRPFDAGEVAMAAVETAHPSLRRSRGELTRRAMVLMIVVVLTVLLIGAVAGGWWRAEQLTPILPSVVAASPSVSASADLAIADALGAEWIADVDDLPEAGVAAGLQRMVIDAGGRTLHVLIGHAEVDVLGSRLDATPTELRITTERAGQGCHARDVGRYRPTTAPDRATLTMTMIEDACAARAALLSRTWWRSLDRASDGGRGVVTAFDPPFLVTLPSATFAGRTYTDAFEVGSSDPERTLFAGKDPWGLTEPCSPSGGAPLTLDPGIDPFVAYLRTLPGFTVATRPLQIDGHRAVHLSITTDAAIDCPGGVIIEWIAKADAPGGVTWHLSPGDPDSLYVVETPTATFLFQYLGPDVTTADEERVLSTIRFVESLASRP